MKIINGKPLGKRQSQQFRRQLKSIERKLIEYYFICKCHADKRAISWFTKPEQSLMRLFDIYTTQKAKDAVDRYCS